MNEFSYLERHMGTDVSVSFICRDKSYADIISQEVFTTITEYEQEFSRFNSNSVLSRLNQAGLLQVSARFLDVLDKSGTLHKLTGGVFNPLVQVAALGYSKTFDQIKGPVSVDLSPYNTNLEEIIINKQTKTVQLAPNQRLDFGGILKGYLATKLVEYVMNKYKDCGGCIINIGGDVATRGLDELNEPFIFMLYNPITGEEVPTTMRDSALATSGTYAREWETKTGKYHHIVEAKTRQNPDGALVTVSIIHKDGATAEALTKLFLISGTPKSITLLPPSTYKYQYLCIDKKGQTETNLI